MRISNNWLALVIGIPIIGFLIWTFFLDKNTQLNNPLGIGSQASNKNWVSAVLSAFPSIDNEGINGVRRIVESFSQWGDGDINKLAYILATAWHESRLIPVRECFASSDQAARNCVQGRSYAVVVNGNVYYGRGYVQLTWANNYDKMQMNLGYSLLSNPDLALNPDIAAQIIVYGMMNGSFTGKKLGNYINSVGSDFLNSRRVVNGTDKAAMIADYAVSILNQYHSI